MGTSTEGSEWWVGVFCTVVRERGVVILEQLHLGRVVGSTKLSGCGTSMGFVKN